MRFWKSPILVGLALATVGCSNTKTDCSTGSESTYLHKYGVRVHPRYGDDRGRNGQMMTTMPDGAVVTQSYTGGHLDGECTYTFPNSNQVYKLELYKNNCLEKESSFYQTGIPKETCEWNGPNKCRLSSWYETGTPRSIEEYQDGLLMFGEYFTTNNLRDSWVYNGDGERVTRRNDGSFDCVDVFSKGQHATRTYFFHGKGPREIISFKDGYVHGERKTFYPDGTPCASESWEQGRKNGITIVYQHGQPYAEVPYVDGKKQGVEKRYSDGQLCQEVSWHDDQMHGVTTTYVGEAVQKDWFYKGRCTSPSNFESYTKTPQTRAAKAECAYFKPGDSPQEATQWIREK